MLPAIRIHKGKYRAGFSLFLLMWFSVTTVGMLAADLKSSHPDCKCGCQSGQACRVNQDSCCQPGQLNQGCCSNSGCCSQTPEKKSCRSKESLPATYRAACQCGKISLDQIVMTKPYDLPMQQLSLLTSPAGEADFDVLALWPQHRDAPLTPPPEVM